jgi:hypothetical protein
VSVDVSGRRQRGYTAPAAVASVAGDVMRVGVGLPHRDEVGYSDRMSRRSGVHCVLALAALLHDRRRRRARRWARLERLRRRVDGVTATRATTVLCADGDPSCDTDATADGACTFSVNLCLLADEPAGCRDRGDDPRRPGDAALAQRRRPDGTGPARDAGERGPPAARPR